MSEPDPNELAFLKSGLTQPGPCPEVAALAGAETSPEIERHLAGCSRCRTELALLREFESGKPGAEELASVQWIQAELLRRAPQFEGAPVAEPQPMSIRERLSHWTMAIFSPRRRFQLSTAGVSLLLIASAGLYFHRAAEPPLANPTRSAIWRSGQFSAVAPVGDITQFPAGFQWDAVPGAAQYRIHLNGVDGIEVWSADSVQPHIEPPQAIRSLLTPGRAFRWTVDARNASGEKIASTVSQTFHILATTR
jgi:hypothetical protein